MCVHYTHLFECGHYTLSKVDCAQGRTVDKCPVYKEKTMEHESECDDCTPDTNSDQEESDESSGSEGQAA